MTRRRVVVTGLGVICSLGNDVEKVWESLLAGHSGIRRIANFDVTDIASKIASQVLDFDADACVPRKEQKKMDVFIQYGLAAATTALADAGIKITDANRQRIGIAVGSGIGGLSGIERNRDALLSGGPRKVSPFFVPGSITNMLAGQISIRFGLQGPNIAIVTACTTGTHNIGEAARIIAYGDADVMIAGGSEATVTPLGQAGFSAARALSTRNDEPERASRPWDRDRDGFVHGEGAGILVLEEYEFAKARGARIYCELAGYGMSADAYHITQPAPNGEGAARCMRNALNDAGLTPSEVDYINAHGTSTVVGDQAESDGIKAVLGEHATKVAISSTKSMLGHLLGAAGGVEAIATVLTLRDQRIHPTINLDNPDPGCDLDYVPHIARDARVEVALSNSFGFGGTNGTLAFRRLT